MPRFVIAVFLSSFLLFAVQPMIAKFLLPSFGGTASVWATCLVVFQTLLLAGYGYAHLLRTKLSPRAQRWTHLSLLAVALLFLPPVPHLTSSAHSGGTPVWDLLRSILTSVGVPFFALSATAPLLMEWFRQSFPGRSPDRLYAFSNAGSLLALLCYPFVLEPLLTRNALAWLWAGGMGLFLLFCATVAWQSRRAGNDGGMTTKKFPVHSVPSLAVKNGRFDWLWVALPACGSALLLALTNQISQDVAPMPLLWIAPLSVYLVTFILCFESARFYRRTLFIPLCFATFFLLAWLLHEGYLHGFWVQISGYLGVLFCTCMVCHGELYRLRPPAENLTTYYLAISLGGALGGGFVALAAPNFFDTLVETPLIVLTVATLCTFMLWRERSGRGGKAEQPKIGTPLLGGTPEWQFAIAGTVLVAGSLLYVVLDQRTESVYFTRNFYGAYRVKEGPTLLMDRMNYPLSSGPARVLFSGQIYHGLQFTDPEAAKIATTYYSDEGGLGFVFRELPARTNRIIGAIGLGTGTLAAYGQPGDHIRFYEINPDVVRIAQTQFTFLTNCPAMINIELGDGRLSLEREPQQNFDLLVLDAFAGDSIPMHLLTEEAMRSYVRHLKPDGVMAFHISNSHLDLDPIVSALAAKHDLATVLVPASRTDVRTGKLPSIWMLVSANEKFLRRPEVLNLMSLSSRSERRAPLLWTDDHSSILSILR